MNESNYASLSAGLLARKGQAKPAMRPQSYNFGGDDDLGWNDMGGADMLTPEQRIALLPAQPMTYAPRPAYPGDAPVASPVHEQQQQVAEFSPQQTAIAPAEAPVAATLAVPMPVVQPTPIHRPRAAPGSKSKAAFTLRLDPQRHMQLRLACVYGHKSAQQLVTAALDDYLSAHFPEAAKGSTKSAAN